MPKGQGVWTTGNRTHAETCFHMEEGYHLIREAEQVAVFDHPASNQVHISVAFEGWYSCQWVGSKTWQEWSQVELMEYVNNRLNDLKSIAGM